MEIITIRLQRFITVYINHACNYNYNQNVLCAFLFIFLLNNFAKFYGYCKVICLKVPIFRVTLVPILVFIHNFLVWQHYSSFIKRFSNLFYLPMPINNGTWQSSVDIFFDLKAIYFSLMLIFNVGKSHWNNTYHI